MGRRYLTICRKIQAKYKLEPAGSKGVHGLDDHQFCCYIFGAAQMLENKEDLRYMFFEAIHFINQMKTGMFAEHSNQLWNISGVERWEKVHLGLIKMYEAEVMKKLPVVQHFYFGSILPFG